MECQKQKNLNFMLFDICYTYTMELYVKDKFCTLIIPYFNVNYMLSNNYCTLLKVSYMLYLSQDYCTLSIDMIYYTNVNCKLSCEYFTVLNSYYTFLVRQNYIKATDLKIEIF